ncbi:LIP-domain-containing protein [Atractiella rhizophila]|nr:LIP-domain-containing protein [Atractiella rhizophila]
MKFSSVASIVLFTVLAQAAPLISRAVLTPSKDPFYKAPAGFANEPLGTILASREVDVGLLGLPSATQAYQLLYRTESQNGTAMATVTTIFVPAQPAAGAAKLLAFNTAEDSTGSICAPSYAYQTGSTQISIIVTFEYLILQGFLNQGWYVVSPDYEGPNSAFGAGRLAGKGVLDSIRATLNYKPLGFSADTQIGIAGYSGGAIASGWAGALQPTYAPELNIVGITQGGTPANISGTLQYLDGTLFAGFGVGGITGLSNSYASINTLLNSIGTILGKAAFALSNAQCAIGNLASFAFQTVQSKLYTSAGANLLYLPAVQAVTKENTLGVNSAETPGAPTYVYHALYDEIIPVGDTDTMVNAYCSNGGNIIYEKNIGLAEHATLEILSIGRVTNFFIDRFAGKAIAAGCTRRNITTAEMLADPQVAGTGMQAVWSQLLGFVGKEL